MTTGCLLPDRNLPTGLPNHEAYFMVSLAVGLLPTVNLIATSCQTELDGMTIGLNRRPDGMRDIDRSLRRCQLFREVEATLAECFRVHQRVPRSGRREYRR